MGCLNGMRGDRGRRTMSRNGGPKVTKPAWRLTLHGARNKRISAAKVNPKKEKEIQGAPQSIPRLFMMNPGDPPHLVIVCV